MNKPIIIYVRVETKGRSSRKAPIRADYLAVETAKYEYDRPLPIDCGFVKTASVSYHHHSMICEAEESGYEGTIPLFVIEAAWRYYFRRVKSGDYPEDDWFHILPVKDGSFVTSYVVVPDAALTEPAMAGEWFINMYKGFGDVPCASLYPKKEGELDTFISIPLPLAWFYAEECQRKDGK